MVKYSHSQTKEKSKEATFIYSSRKGTGKNRLVGAIRRFSFICWSLLSPNRNLRDEIRIVSPLSHLLVLPSVLFYFCIFPKERTFHFKSIISLDWTPRQLAAVRSKKMLYYVTNAIAVSSFQSEREWYVFFFTTRKGDKQRNEIRDRMVAERRKNRQNVATFKRFLKQSEPPPSSQWSFNAAISFSSLFFFFHITWKIQPPETDGSISFARSVFSDR